MNRERDSSPRAAIAASSGGWDDAARWSGDGWLREAFFFRSGPDRLYGSLYASARRERSLGLLVCPSWGSEGRALLEWCHRLALGVAKLGGCGLVLHWPGFQDSLGDARDVSFDRLTRSCLDAVAAAATRCPVQRWSLAGVRIGAAAAAVAAPELSAPYCLLVQPALDPVAYFDEVARAGRRVDRALALPENWAFGHPLPPALRTRAAAEQVSRALEGFRGRRVLVHYEHPLSPPGPAAVETVTVRGDWRSPPMPAHQALLGAALTWLRRASSRAA